MCVVKLDYVILSRVLYPMYSPYLQAKESKDWWQKMDAGHLNTPQEEIKVGRVWVGAWEQGVWRSVRDAGSRSLGPAVLPQTMMISCCADLPASHPSHLTLRLPCFVCGLWPAEV